MFSGGKARVDSFSEFYVKSCKFTFTCVSCWFCFVLFFHQKERAVNNTRE